MHLISKEFDEYCVLSTLKGLQMENIYKYTKFTNVSRVKYAVYPLYLIGNIVDSTAVHKKPRKKSRPVFEHVLYTFYGSSIIGTIGIMIKRTLCIGI